MSELSLYLEADGKRLIDSTTKYSNDPFRTAINLILDTVDILNKYKADELYHREEAVKAKEKQLYNKEV